MPDTGIVKRLVATVDTFLESVGARGYSLAQVANVPGPGGPGQLEASIRFSSPTICGAIVVVPDREFIDETMPDPVQANLVPAWVGEMTNRVVGIFKGQAALAGIALDFDLPKVGPNTFAAAFADPQQLPMRRTIALRYRRGTSALKILIRFAADPQTTFVRDVAPDAVVGNPSTMLIF